MPVIAVQDAYRRVEADILYGCDAKWWNAHNGCPDFTGEKWSTHGANKSIADNKLEVAEKYGVNLVRGDHGKGFGTDRIHYGDNSGHQALNLAILMGARFIILVGYDMRRVDGKSHFFGEHPQGLHQRDEYESFASKFGDPPGLVRVINATPGSALTAYPIMEFADALNRCLYWYGTKPDAGTGKDCTEERL